MRDNLKLIRQATREGVVEASAIPIRVGVKVTSLDQRVKLYWTLALAGLVTAMSTTFAWAVGSNCGGQSASTLSKFIGNAATFLIAIGGALALLMFAVGALFIIAGGTQERVSRGMKMLKNAVIGLIVLIAGFFIKTIVVKFVEGATTGSNASKCVGQGDSNFQ